MYLLIIQFLSASSMSDALIITSYFSLYKNLDYLSAQSAVLNIMYQKEIILKTPSSLFLSSCFISLAFRKASFVNCQSCSRWFRMRFSRSTNGTECRPVTYDVRPDSRTFFLAPLFSSVATRIQSACCLRVQSL